MAITYNWKLLELRKTNTANLNDIVVGTRWECVGTDENGNTGKFNGATPFSASSVDPNNFVDWNSLTEETVLGWIQEILNRGGMNHVQEQIGKQIDLKINPITEVNANNFPWIVQ